MGSNEQGPWRVLQAPVRRGVLEASRCARRRQGRTRARGSILGTTPGSGSWVWCVTRRWCREACPLAQGVVPEGLPEPGGRDLASLPSVRLVPGLNLREIDRERGEDVISRHVDEDVSETS